MSSARLLLAFLLIVTMGAMGCDADESAAHAFVSEPLPLCGESPTRPDCDEFGGEGVVEALAGDGSEALDAAALSARTGLRWETVSVPSDPLHIDLAAVHGSDQTDVSSFVVELVEAEAPRDTLVSIASNDGMALWVNGQPVARSRYPRRGASRDSDVARIKLRAGTNVIVYKVLQGDTEWRLYRESWSPAQTSELLRRAIAADAYADLPTTRILPDTATSVGLKPNAVALMDTPEIRFRWVTLLGEPLWESPVYLGQHPASLPLPVEYAGALALHTEVREPGSGTVLYFEDAPIFSDSTAQRMARELSDVTPSEDPVHVARSTAVRRLFGLSRGTRPASAWMRSRALGDLYRVIRDPAGYHRYPGAQIWGYRRPDEDAVEPYWLAVPPGLGVAEPTPRPLVFSVNHMTGPDFWRGRGAAPGFVIRQSTLAATFGGFGVIPRLGGANEFAVTGVHELAAITEQLAGRFPVATDRVGLLVWSYHATSALRMALDPSVSLSHLALAVPDVRMAGLDVVLDSLARLRPELRLQLWSGESDDVVLPPLVELLAERMRAQGLSAEHIEVPYSTHLGGLLYDVESEIRRTMEAAEGMSSMGATPRSEQPARP
jgi:hypothetical protein